MKYPNDTKFIFLDLDGVMNSEIYFVNSRKGLDLEESGNQIDPRAIDILNQIYDKTNCKVVISSAWRQTCFHGKILQERGFNGDVVGVTHHISSVCRGVEIKKWIDDNIESPHEYSKYVILDDDTDMLLSQQFNFFRTDGYCGLTHNIGHEVIAFLNHGVRA